MYQRFVRLGRVDSIQPRKARPVFIQFRDRILKNMVMESVSKLQWQRQKEEVGWALASVRQPNAEGMKSEAPRGRGAAGAETSAEGVRVEVL